MHAAFGEDVRKFFDGLSFENWAPRSSRTWRLPPTQRKAVQTGACAGRALGPYAACAVGCAAVPCGEALRAGFWAVLSRKLRARGRALRSACPLHLGRLSRPAVYGFHGPSCGPWQSRGATAYAGAERGGAPQRKRKAAGCIAEPSSPSERACCQPRASR